MSFATAMLGFLHISFIDILDVLLVALIIFYVFRMMRGSQALSIFFAIISLFAFRIIADALDMELISGLLGALLDVGLLAVIVLFQPEIRRFLNRIGNTYSQAGGRFRIISNLFRRTEGSESAQTINEICKACEEMSFSKCGALIAIQRNNSLSYIEETGDIIDARVSRRLLMNLFFKNSPLHDGAVIIASGRVRAARCTLPITESELPPSFGMRHKAAMGMSEMTDAIVILVSEETGHICVMQNGKYNIINNINDLKLALQGNGRGE